MTCTVMGKAIMIHDTSLLLMKPMLGVEYDVSSGARCAISLLFIVDGLLLNESETGVGGMDIAGTPSIVVKFRGQLLATL